MGFHEEKKISLRSCGVLSSHQFLALGMVLSCLLFLCINQQARLLQMHIFVIWITFLSHLIHDAVGFRDMYFVICELHIIKVRTTNE